MCSSDLPIALLRAAGTGALALDVRRLGTDTPTLDAIGETWDAGTPLLLGLVPALPPPDKEPTLRELARPAFDLADRIGFARPRLAELAVPTPTCGLAGATPDWARRAMALAADLGKAFVEPPESWAKDD